MVPQWTVGPGRTLEKDGVPQFYINRATDRNLAIRYDMTVSEADKMAHTIRDLLQHVEEGAYANKNLGR